ncbi:hypothetical protein FRUB_06952 [Fimbriiglobus ruber]|uniref:Uncharacterized protein n=2 Tax=Fimbriiglobus ruber TaxID=1908690 RepID=A0A225D8Q6_9BACT|nr:hypothetical protein FRUB_06952 [Fimbriiglobus ruber]
MLFWTQLMARPAPLPEEEITIVEAKDSVTGKSTVRIPLNGIETPIKGQRCYLEATDEGMRLLDSGGEILTAIPAGEIVTRIHLPSFWGTSSLMIEWENKEEPFHFETKKDVVQQVRDLVAVSLKLHPEAAIEAMRKRGFYSLAIGGVCLALGVVVTFTSFAAAGANGRFYIMTGLLGFGTASLCRGLYWLVKAANLKSKR